MPFFRNSKGMLFRSGIGGTYPVNDGNPENDVDDDDVDTFNDLDNSDDIINRMEERCL